MTMVKSYHDEEPFLHNHFQQWEGSSRLFKWCLSVFIATAIFLVMFQFQTGILQSLWVSSEPEVHNVYESHAEHQKTCSGFFGGYDSLKRVEKKVSIDRFGGVGDGVTSNSLAFQSAIEYLKPFAKNGSWVQLSIPPGRWVTGCFNVTSNFVLFLHKDAILLGSKDINEWPLIDPLPSYGRGRERPGRRHISLIHGENLKNVIITGENGTIDGQGSMWWDMWFNRTLQHTRGHLAEFVNSENILISNITFLNSPFWNIHPVYCKNVVIQQLTILAPLKAPNTDGIDADSSTYVCIEDCYIESGDDLVAIKSGWDQYGIAYGRPSSNIIVRRVTGTTPTCSGIGIGSEMSGGIKDVIIENIKIYNTASGIKVKTDKGRGGYVTNITISDIYMENVRAPIKFSTQANDHPDDMWNPNDLPVINGIIIKNVKGKDIHNAPSFKGLNNVPFVNVHLLDVKLEGIPLEKSNWHCEHVEGFFSDVKPQPCSAFQQKL